MQSPKKRVGHTATIWLSFARTAPNGSSHMQDTHTLAIAISFTHMHTYAQKWENGQKEREREPSASAKNCNCAKERARGWKRDGATCSTVFLFPCAVEQFSRRSLPPVAISLSQRSGNLVFNDLLHTKTVAVLFKFERSNLQQRARKTLKIPSKY